MTTPTKVIFYKGFALFQAMPNESSQKAAVGRIFHTGDVVTDAAIISALITANAPIYAASAPS